MSAPGAAVIVALRLAALAPPPVGWAEVRARAGGTPWRRAVAGAATLGIVVSVRQLERARHALVARLEAALRGEAAPAEVARPCPVGLDLRRPIEVLRREQRVGSETIRRWRREAGIVVARGRPPRRGERRECEAWP